MKIRVLNRRSFTNPSGHNSKPSCPAYQVEDDDVRPFASLGLIAACLPLKANRTFVMLLAQAFRKINSTISRRPSTTNPAPRA